MKPPILLSANGEELRHCTDWKQVSKLYSEETIVEFINRFADILPEYERLREKEEANRAYHRKHQAKQKALLKVAQELLDPDELAEINRQAETEAAK